MTEKHLILEEADPAIFYGINNANMQTLKALYPKLRIVARGNIIKVMGDEEELAAFDEIIQRLQAHCARYNSLSEEDILHIAKGERTARDGISGAIVFSVNGKPSPPAARTSNGSSVLSRHTTWCSPSDRQARERPTRASLWPCEQ